MADCGTVNSSGDQPEIAVHGALGVTNPPVRSAADVRVEDRVHVVAEHPANMVQRVGQGLDLPEQLGRRMANVGDAADEHRRDEDAAEELLIDPPVEADPC